MENTSIVTTKAEAIVSEEKKFDIKNTSHKNKEDIINYSGYASILY